LAATTTTTPAWRARCHTKLSKFSKVRGHFLCSDHLEADLPLLTCYVCQLPVEPDQRLVQVVGKALHSKCLVCAKCNKSLKRQQVELTRDGRLVCELCDADRAKKKKSHQRDLSQDIEGGKFFLNLLGRESSSVNRLAVLADLAETTHSRSDSGELDRKKGRHSRGPSLDFLAPPRRQEIKGGLSGQASEELDEGRITWRRGELIGHGSFGKVYMAFNSDTGELCAVKRILIKKKGSRISELVEQETKILTQLRHPNIVNLLDVQYNGSFFDIIMEYVSGKSLDLLLEKFGKFSENTIISYTQQLLRALVYLHSRNVAHRDIKGRNILVDGDGALKLADFGGAKEFSENLGDSPSMDMQYTPLWTAPEVLQGTYDSKVDIWSLGCTIIEMATALPPWQEQNFVNPFQALFHIGSTDKLPRIPDSLSGAGRDFLLQCLVKDPEKRPTAEELLRHDWMQ
jgi:serine/threonine protein kinase